MRNNIDKYVNYMTVDLRFADIHKSGEKPIYTQLLDRYNIRRSLQWTKNR